MFLVIWGVIMRTYFFAFFCFLVLPVVASSVENIPDVVQISTPLQEIILPKAHEWAEAIGHTDEKQKTVLFEDYMWKQPPQSIIKDLAYLYLTAKLHTILFQSLLAEQAARFLSMDNSTRNAEGLLELSKIQYNKLRQAKITKEINELVSSMSNN
jgi:F-type H+-transporting ATPase subunit gamma